MRNFFFKTLVFTIIFSGIFFFLFDFRYVNAQDKGHGVIYDCADGWQSDKNDATVACMNTLNDSIHSMVNALGIDITDPVPTISYLNNINNSVGETLQIFGIFMGLTLFALAFHVFGGMLYKR